MNSILQDRDFTAELHFSAVRSSGPGGQNVNKVSSKVELRFQVESSSLLTDDEKVLILKKLATKINTQGELVLTSQSERTQLKNKEKVIAKFLELLSGALRPRKKRKPSRPTQASVEERLEIKRLQSEKKERRRKDIR